MHLIPLTKPLYTLQSAGGLVDEAATGEAGALKVERETQTQKQTQTQTQTQTETHREKLKIGERASDPYLH